MTLYSFKKYVVKSITCVLLILYMKSNVCICKNNLKIKFSCKRKGLTSRMSIFLSIEIFRSSSCCNTCFYPFFNKNRTDGNTHWALSISNQPINGNYRYCSQKYTSTFGKSYTREHIIHINLLYLYNDYTHGNSRRGHWISAYCRLSQFPQLHSASCESYKISTIDTLPLGRR